MNIPKDPKGSKKTVSNSDTVQNGQSPELTDSVSKTDTLTVSNLDTTQYNKQINLKHTLPESLKVYFENLKPERKRKQEEGAFKELTREFSVVQIESALLHIQKHGIGEHKEKPHSPMAYLAVAMESILKKLPKTTNQSKPQDTTISKNKTTEQENEEKAHYEKAILEFQSSFKTIEDQDSYFKSYSKNLPFLNSSGEVFKRIAILEWYKTYDLKVGQK
ncbi:MAG: hypothetical protein KA715_12715 [Xanthomonadaceae bacterium]|nr:hypothetical protein [Xanthomonadaceae bacterium]